MAELALADAKAIFAPSFLRQLEEISLCGNYGDAVVARDTLPVLAYFRSENSSLRVILKTNGSARTPAWWAELAQHVTFCRFAIDGLSDTHSIYRVDTDFHRILRNARAFIDAGGRAEWQFIVFRHNEHQVEEAIRLAREIGFSRILFRKTNRFSFVSARSSGERSPGDDATPPVAYLAAPSRAEYRSRSLVTLDPSRSWVEENDPVVEAAPIDCAAARQRALFISAEGLVFPCCYVGQIYAGGDGTSLDHNDQHRILDRLPGGKQALSALHQPLASIIGGPYFQSTLPQLWTRGSFADGKPRTCARICSVAKKHTLEPELDAIDLTVDVGEAG